MWFGGGGANPFSIQGSADTYALLPDATTFDGELWFVKSPKTFSLHPRGIYYATGGAWEQSTIKVKWSEDAGSFVNWTVWSDWYNGAEDINLGDRVIYNDITYRNRTGVQTATAPDTDTTNWERVTPAQTVYVRSMDDYPAPVGGVVTLENATYTHVANISTDLIFKPPATGYCVQESAGNDYIHTYTGTGAMYTDPAMTGNLVLDHFQLEAPNGAVFDLVGTTGNEVLIETATFYDVKSIGTIKDCDTSTKFWLVLLWGQGLVIDGGYLFMSSSTVTQGLNEAGAVILTIQGDIDSLILNTNGFVTNGANERCLDIKSTSIIDEGAITSNRFRTVNGGDVFASGSFTYKDPPLLFSGNVGLNIVNSSVACAATLKNNVSTTIIPAPNAYTLINATGWLCDEDSVETERNILNTDGVSTYTGLNKDNIRLDGNIAPDPALATKNLSVSFVNIHSHTLYEITFTNATGTINETGTLLENGDTISFYDTPGTLPTGLRKDLVYFVVNKLANSFQVSYTLGGAVVPFTDDGTPVNKYAKCTLSGSEPQQSIAAGTPRDLVPQALITVENGDRYGVFTRNLDDSVNMNCGNAYYRVSN